MRSSGEVELMEQSGAELEYQGSSEDDEIFGEEVESRVKVMMI